jgi:hypothetical protein
LLCLDNEIDVALKADGVLAGLLGGEFIYEHDETLTEDLPDTRVIYEEVDNSPEIGADDSEFASRIVYRVSVCSETNLIATVNAVERVMVAIGFCRDSIDIVRGLPNGVKGKVILFEIVRECL